MRRKIYIAGKITGDGAYAQKFARAARIVTNASGVALNPAELPAGMEPRDYMRVCLSMIDVADEVFFMRDYSDSGGALVEHAYCIYTGKPVRYIE